MRQRLGFAMAAGALALVVTATAVAAPSPPALAYARADVQPRALAWSELPYNEDVPPVHDTWPHDRDGVRYYRSHGRLYDHPVAQAGYGLRNLNGYVLGRGPLYLRRAVANAERIILRRVEVGDAWWFPYRFSYGLHGRTPVMAPPWYSGMAQGQALSLFVRLYEVTGEHRWLVASLRAMSSLTPTLTRSSPWVTDIDDDGFLWIEEWPSSKPDRALNGHVFASFGLYDLWRVTGDPRALDLFKGTLATVLRYAPRFRDPAWVSRYCLLHGVRSPRYHFIHVSQAATLYRMTAAPALVRIGETLWNDYPRSVAGVARLVRGTIDGIKMRGTRVSERARVTITRSVTVRFARRTRLPGLTGYWLGVSTGRMSGYWVKETPRRAYALGLHQRFSYSPPRSAVIRPGSWTAVRYDRHGDIVARRTVRFTDARVQLTHAAVASGVAFVRMGSGPAKGYWIARSLVRTFDA